MERHYNGGAKSEWSAMSIVGMILGATGLIFCPIVFSSAGIVLGLVANSRGDDNGKLVAIVSTVTLIVGAMLSFIILIAMGEEW